MMTPAECVAARSLLNWTQLQLAEASGTDAPAIRNFEDGRIAPVEANAEALRRALEAAGVRFVSEIGGGAGVRLRKLGGPHDEGKRPEGLDATNDD